MRAILLAGGMGTRIQHLYPDIPKPMIPIDGKPFLEYLINSLNKYLFIDNIIVSVGYKKEKIMDYFGNKVSYSVEEEPLGTSGALYKAMCLFDNENVLVMNADSFLNIELNSLIVDYYKKLPLIKKIGAIVVKKVKDASRYGTITFDKDYKIEYFKEKEQTADAYINLGIYIFRYSIKNHLLEKGSLEKDVFPLLEDLYAIPVPEETEFIDIGTEETLKKVDEWKKMLL